MEKLLPDNLYPSAWGGVLRYDSYVLRYHFDMIVSLFNIYIKIVSLFTLLI